MKRSREEFEHGLKTIWSSVGQIGFLITCMQTISLTKIIFIVSMIVNSQSITFLDKNTYKISGFLSLSLSRRS